ncbi:hypothetical protein [Paenibacillus cremeus]|uniref:hypothetical protein n=1 Tax=Paenibacillus cremeus TaxID=2163881 RepID=UPI0016458B30|nr:hypothetical protein [Paenibacillus cremeus]
MTNLREWSKVEKIIDMHNSNDQGSDVSYRLYREEAPGCKASRHDETIPTLRAAAANL